MTGGINNFVGGSSLLNVAKLSYLGPLIFVLSAKHLLSGKTEQVKKQQYILKIPKLQWFWGFSFDITFFLVYTKYTGGYSMATELRFEQRQTRQELNYEISSWCRKKGIRYGELDTHSQIDDVIILIKFKDEMWNDMDASERGIWGRYWGFVYNHKLPLKQAYLDKLLVITNSVIFKRQKQAERLATIQALRKKLKTA
jgi:hypothetical protein